MDDLPPHRFPTTNWSVVLDAASPSSESAQAAMSDLCARYRNPVFKFILGKCRDIHQAEDLTQGFFEFVIRKGVVQHARKERGRFRNFLGTSIQHFLHNQHDRATAAKRGGRHRIDPLDTDLADSLAAPSDSPADIRAFDREWALALVARAMESLAADYASRNRRAAHDALLPFLTRSATGDDYQNVGAALGISKGAAEQACRALRARFGTILRREVALTVSRPDDIEGEIRHLLAILAEQ